MYYNYYNLYAEWELGMPKKYFFTINLLIRSDTNIKKSIASVIDNEKFFRENVQLILIDSVGSELSISVCAEYSSQYPENIYFVDAVGKNPARSYNDAAPIAAGMYVSYTDNYGCYSKGALQTVMNLVRSGKIPVFCIMPTLSMPGEAPTPYISDIKSGIIQLHDTPDKTILLLGCYFFSRKISDRLSFDANLRFHHDAKYIVEVLLMTYSYVFSDKCQYVTIAPTERNGKRFAPQYSQAFYTKTVKEFILPMLKSSHDSVLVQSAMMYLLEVKFALNADDRYNNILVGSHIKGFFDAAADAMDYIDDTVILNKRLCRICGLDEEAPFRFLRLKYRNPGLKAEIDLALPKEELERKYYIAPNRMEALSMKGEFAAHIKSVLIARSKEITAEIRTINFDREGVYIDAVLNGCSYMSEDDYSVFAVINGEKTSVIPSKVYTLVKFFGQSFLRRFSFRLFIPVAHNKKMDTISICFRYNKMAFKLNLIFRGVYSGLSETLKGSFLNIGDKVLSYDSKNKCLVLRRATDSLIALSESRMMTEAAKNMNIADYALCRRIRSSAKSLLKDKENKKILVFYEDQGINFNGNLLFRYFFKYKTDAFEPYICVKRDSAELAFLHDRGYDNILEIGSAKAKAVILAADYLFASGCDPYDSLGFSEKDKLYFRDMIRAKTISVKNGFVTYHTAQFNNRLRDNTQFVFCTSAREKNQMLSPVYDFDRSMIRTAGNPVLDAVSDKREKLILIAPGDRRLFNIYENSDYYRFSDSSFFKAYNNLISDFALLRSCRENGWRIAVLMPKAVEKYLKLFQSDDIVTLYPATEQNESSLTSRASVLVTDYSDLQYRFAYTDKNVVYYFPPGLPIHSEHTGENISQYGFGEIFFEHNLLCVYLIKGMENGFKQGSKYELRKKEFFGNNDKGNCKRIYEEIMKIIK